MRSRHPQAPMDAMGEACANRGFDVDRHEPVYVEEVVEDACIDAGASCNYACF
ncbi:MAG: hypothetical protein ACLFMX_05890 [Halobacteriales archaeon]